MSISIDEQIADIKNNIRYFCKKCRWENFETDKHHKHHHSKSKKKLNDKAKISENQYNNSKKNELHKKISKLQTSTIKHKETIEEPTSTTDEHPQKTEYFMGNTSLNEELEPNKEKFNINNNKQVNIHVNFQQKEKSIQNKPHLEVFEDISQNKDQQKQICLYSSDYESDSSFDFKEFKEFFKVQDELYHLTKKSKGRKSKERKIMLCSSSDSSDSDSSFNSEKYQLKNIPDLKNYKQKNDNYLAPIKTKNQATNTAKKQYKSVNTQTTIQNHAKINFAAKLKFNASRNLQSYLNSSSNSESNSNSHSSSRNSYGNSNKQSSSGKAYSDQYASSENELSKESNKSKNADIKKKSTSSSSMKSTKSSQSSIKAKKIENKIELIEEEEEETDIIGEKMNNDKFISQSSNTKSNSSSGSNTNQKLSKRENDAKNSQISKEKVQIKDSSLAIKASNDQNNDKEVKKNGEKEFLEKISQSAQLIIQHNSDISELNHDEDIDKLMDEISQNSTKIKVNIKKSKNNKKKPNALKNGSNETDENTEAYSQIPSEFSDNIGVNSSLGAKKDQVDDQAKSEEIVQTKKMKVLKLEDFMEQSDNIPVSANLEKEDDGAKKNYNRYELSSDSV